MSQMNKEKTMDKKVNRGTGYLIVGILICLAVLSIGQLFQQLVQILVIEMTGIRAVAYGVSGILYILAVWLMLRLICDKVFHIPLSASRLARPYFSWKWGIAAFELPAAVIAGTLCFSGQWIVTGETRMESIAIIIQQIFVYGLGGGIVEEMIFRGVMMSRIEQRYGKKMAILLPSFIFAAGHLAMAGSNPVALIMIFISGMMVAVMFSLIAFESGSVWPGAFIHAVWNTLMLGGIFEISAKPSGNSIVAYQLDKTSHALIEGYFYIEASWIAMIGYGCIITIALLFIKRQYIKDK